MMTTTRDGLPIVRCDVCGREQLTYNAKLAPQGLDARDLRTAGWTVGGDAQHRCPFCSRRGAA